MAHDTSLFWRMGVVSWVSERFLNDTVEKDSPMGSNFTEDLLRSPDERSSASKAEKHSTAASEGRCTGKGKGCGITSTA